MLCSGMFEAAAVLRQLGISAKEIYCDSRQVSAGSIFAAYPGASDDGRRYIKNAIAAGAAGVLWDPKEFALSQDIKIPNVAVSKLATRIGQLADEIYCHPSHQVWTAAVSGTNGKTTVSHFAAQLLAQSGRRAAVIGTLGAGVIGESMRPLDNTTPDAITIHRLIRDFNQHNIQAAIIENSSHGIAQKRLAGVSLKAAALINIGYDHLDYHGGIENYRKVKSQFLQTEMLETAIINADDEYCVTAGKKTTANTLWTFGERGDTLQLLSLAEREGRSIMRLRDYGEFELPFVGRHNVDNFMAAALIAQAAGAAWEDFNPHLLSLPRGRLQRVNPREFPQVYIDYAHTPDALSAALSSFATRHGRLWVVFGCGGNRDFSKRQQMGKIASSLADVTIVTDDNPRYESADAIRAEIMLGGLNLLEIPKRQDAIAMAIAEADAKDIILIAGKGHETYQQIGDVRYECVDEDIARQALAARAGRRLC